MAKKQSQLELLITAKDLTGRGVKSVFNSIKKVGYQSKRTDRILEPISNQFANWDLGITKSLKSMGGFGRTGAAAFQAIGGSAAIAFAGITGSITAAIGAAVAFGSAMSDALQVELQRVQATNAYVNTSGLSYEKSLAYTQDLRERIAQLGIDLPVSIDAISNFANSVGDDVNIAVRSAGGTAKQANAATADIASRLAVTQLGTGVTDRQMMGFADKFLSGSASFKQLRILAAVQKNSQLRQALEKVEKEYGDLKKLSKIERTKALQKALQMAVTDADVKRLSKTGEATLSGFMDTLFSQEKGLFSFSRDLDPTQLGYQSVGSEFSETLNLLIGKDGIIPLIGGMFSDLTGGMDPMVVIKQVLQGVNFLLNILKEFLKAIKAVTWLFRQIITIGGLTDYIGGFGKQTKALPGTTDKNGKNGVSIFTPFEKAGDWWFSSLESIGKSLVAKPKYAGNWIPAYDGYFGALQREIAHMPIGASPVIANTSEVILTPDQFRSVLGQAYTTSGGSHYQVTIDAPITIQGTSDPTATAQAVVVHLNRLFQNALDVKLA